MLRHFGEVPAVLPSPGGVGLLTALRPPQAHGLQTWSAERVTEASRGRFRPWVRSRGPRGACCGQGPVGLAAGGPVPRQPSLSSWVKRGGAVGWTTVDSPWFRDTFTVHTPLKLSHWRKQASPPVLWGAACPK